MSKPIDRPMVIAGLWMPVWIQAPSYSFSPLLLGDRRRRWKRPCEKSIITWLLCCISVIVTSPVLHMAPSRKLHVKRGDCWIHHSQCGSSCWWPSSYQGPRGGRSWGAVSWWLLEFLLQIQRQRVFSRPQHLMYLLGYDAQLKWVHRSEKACHGKVPVRFTH